MDKYVGKRLDGRYELREIIGVGGMAYVYKAYDEIDDRIVAVKILKEEYINNEEFSRRFKNESKAIAILSHPNIVRVIDVSFGVNMQYIVMEYIDGITLKEYIEQQKALQWKEVVHFIVQILHALQHAHDKGIVHQDVKPQNIMLLSDGTIKVTDFGIARFSRVSVGQTSEHGDKAIGSVHYISPEQARAEITDEKSDIYSVGVMMYEMLTGKLPFESDNAVSVAIMQMQSVAERPTVLNPDIPEGLEEITLKAMQKEPSERYQSAAEMLYDIDEFKNNPSIRFEYQYLSGTESNTMHYEEAFRSIRGTEKERPARRRPERQSKVHDQEADGETENTFPLIPVLAGVAGALVLVALVVMLFVFLGSFGGNNADSPNTHQAMTEFEVPTFVGQNYELDIKNNEDYQRNFTINVRYEVSDGEAGEVLNQSPKAGLTVKKGSLIVLTVSSGKEKVAVPTVKAGDDKDEAIARLKEAGFEVREVPQSDEKVEKGKVVSINPIGGSKCEKGSVITVYVSSGKEAVDNTKVPNVVGHPKEKAIEILKEKGFKVNEGSFKLVNHPTYGEGIVTEQTPEADKEVAPGSEVVLTLSSGYHDVEIKMEMPGLLNVNVDLKREVDGKEQFSKSGISLPTQAQTFTVSEQKETYTVKVYLAEAGTGNYKLYATFTVNGKEGRVVSTDYTEFTVPTTAAPTTTTTESLEADATTAPLGDG